MSSVEEKLARSLTAESVELIQFLPYLLQDLWDLGSSPQDMLDLVRQHVSWTGQLEVLDLACGKGAVSIVLARELGCRIKGIDILPDFIDYARHKAVESGVAGQCLFEVGDINQSVEEERAYDLVIFGAVGDVLGDPAELLPKLKRTIKDNGYILLDDGYGQKGSAIDHFTRGEWLAIFDQAGVRLIAEKLFAPDDMKEQNRRQQASIAIRAQELKAKNPGKSDLFDGYIKSQLAECDQLENGITGVTLLLQSIC